MFELLEIPRFEWVAYCSEAAHEAAFGTVKKAESERLDFALLAVKNEIPMGYITCREHDDKTVYWQFGAAFPGTKGTAGTYKIYSAAVEHCLKRYDRILTYIGNTNTAMLRLAMQVGFRVTGVRNYDGEILVEHTISRRLPC